jgi:hypothetical protein
VLNSTGQSREIKGAKYWPLIVVASFFLLEGLSAGNSAFKFASQFGHALSLAPAIEIDFAVLNAIISIALIVAGVGLFARIRASLTVAVILAGFYLLSASAIAIEALFGPTATPMSGMAATAFVVVGWLQYVILRSKSTRSLFYPEAADAPTSVSGDIQ